mgnify:CR=1 FL=1
MDKLYYNGKIYSVDDRNTVYNAVGIDKGKIVFLGNEDIDFDSFTEKIDLQGKSVYPGFVDSHLHMLNYAFVKQSYGMQNESSIEQLIEEGRAISEKMDSEKNENWLYGRGWNEQGFIDEKRFITRFDLDKISKTRPILFIRVCGHIAAVNTVALNIILSLEATKQFVDQIDADNGLLTEASVKLCYNVMKEPDVNQIKEMILLAQSDLNHAGITGVETDNFLSLPGRNSARIMQAYKELEAEEKLTLRIREQASFTSFDDMKKFIDAGNQTGDGGEYYSLGPIKLYEDGSLGAKTALMNTFYEGTTDYGVAVHDQEDTYNLVDYAYKNDMQILVHAIGDRASDMVMNAYEKAIEKYGQKDLRLAINHLQFISGTLIERMKKANIFAYIQPLFVASDKNVVRGLVGEQAEERSYAWKTMIDNNIVCCGGSDSPVEDFDVLSNIQIAVTRDCLSEKTNGWHPEQKLTTEEALRMFTINNAYGAFEENRRGSIEIGKDADMTILQEDLFEADPHEIAKIKVMETIVAGNTVYRAE